MSWGPNIERRYRQMSLDEIAMQYVLAEERDANALKEGIKTDRARPIKEHMLSRLDTERIEALINQAREVMKLLG